MDFFDDETSRVPADAEGPVAAPQSRRRPPDSRRRTRVQRLIILGVVLFAVVFGIAWWARSCQHNRKVDTYRGYYAAVAGAIDDSVALGKKVSAIMEDPAKLSRKELIAELDALSAQQEEIAVRAGRLEPPGTLADEQAVFATGMKVRADGFALLRTAMVSALDNKKIGVKDVAALDGYFSGPDAYYQKLAYTPAVEIMADEGVSDVAVPTSTYFLTWTALDPATVTLALESVGKSSKLTGIHGVALIDVTAQGSSGDLKLVRGRTNNVPASPDLSFLVQIQNQGSVAEKNVKVEATMVLPGGGDANTIKQEATIAAIDAGKTKDVSITGFTIPTEALTRKVKLTVEALPVQGERVESNNKATYTLLLELK